MCTNRLAVSAVVSRAAIVAVIAGLTAGCSSDTTRFSDDPFSNPFNGRTAYAQRGERSAAAAPVGRVESRALNQDTVPQQFGRSQVDRSPFAGNDGDTTASIGNRARAAVKTPAANQVAGMTSSGKGGWSPVGGTTITAGAGDTVASLSSRYGVPAAAIAQANGFSANQALAPGQSLVIPTYSMNGGTPSNAVPPMPPKVATTRATAPKGWSAGPQPAARPTEMVAPRPAGEAKPVAEVKKPVALRHVVNHGETLGGIAKRYGLSRSELAKANKLADNASVSMGQTLTVPSKAPAKAAANSAPSNAAPAKAEAKPDAKRSAVAEAKPVAAPTPDKKAEAKPAPKVAAAKPAKADPVTTGSLPVQAAKPVETAREVREEKQVAVSGEPQFRWPVRGRVIASYGQSVGGATSEGMRLAVPQGTAVRAAEDGKVAYAGSELKHLGNLVLVRHTGGYVSVYAHNSEITVKPGEEVRRGQTIAKAGQTGNATSPQLYFEIRKGKQPIDPMEFLGRE